MSSNSKVTRSRGAWKRKAVDRARGQRYYKKETRRYKKERDFHKNRAEKSEAKLLQYESRANLPTIESKVDTVDLALQLFLVAKVGFRAVSKVLAVMAPYLGLVNVPCPQTVINWVTRLSIARIQDAALLIRPSKPVTGDFFSNGFVWMIDATVGFSTGKVLAVLALDIRHHATISGAPTINNVHCIAVSVAVSWTGELIADFLKKVIGVLGRPVAFLKDGGSDLGKAVRLLGEQGITCNTIADVSHVIANLFKHAYGDHPQFDVFISTVGKISQNIKLTILACLAPPKTSTKARFMNLHRLIRWASLILELNLPKRTLEGAPLKKLRDGLSELPDCREYIADFLRDAQAMSDCQKLLKNSGLNDQTAAECQKIISGMPENYVRKGFENWLNDHHQLAKQMNLEKGGLPITTDQEESLFGLAKDHGVGEIKDPNRIALHLPALAGTLTKQDAHRVLEITTAMQRAVEAPLTSLIKQRRAIAKNPHDIENLLAPSKLVHLEMMPQSKNGLKNSNDVIITSDYTKTTGPQNRLEIDHEFQPLLMNSG